MTHQKTFLPPAALERSRERERRVRQRRGKRLGRLMLPVRFERRDALLVLLVLVSLGAALRYTQVLDRWFDRFNGSRPDQQQAAESLAGPG